MTSLLAMKLKSRLSSRRIRARLREPTYHPGYRYSRAKRDGSNDRRAVLPALSQLRRPHYPPELARYYDASAARKLPEYSSVSFATSQRYRKQRAAFTSKESYYDVSVSSSLSLARAHVYAFLSESIYVAHFVYSCTVVQKRDSMYLAISRKSVSWPGSTQLRNRIYRSSGGYTLAEKEDLDSIDVVFMSLQMPFRTLRGHQNLATRAKVAGGICTIKDHRSNINEASVLWHRSCIFGVKRSEREWRGEGVAACPGNRCLDLVAM